MSLEALFTSAAFAPIENVGWLRVTGEDRVRWLNGMTTNNIAALNPGRGCYTFFLNAQGHILADATAWVLDDSILLETADPTSLATLLDRFIIMDDVELAPISNLAGILIAGPNAQPIVGALGTRTGSAAQCTPSYPAALADTPDLKQTLYAGSSVYLIRAHSPLTPRFELWTDPATLATILAELAATQIPQASVADLEQFRILSGTPLYGTDIRNTEAHKDLPQETNQTRALHFSKGCYLGQEIVERIRSRGAVHRTFTGFTLHGELPPAGTSLFAADSPARPVGELTSVASTALGTFALGYIRREVLDASKSIQYAGGTATPSALPFPIETMKRA